MKDFFISYTQADREWAEWIGWKLEEANYTVVLQAWDFVAGSNFVLQMNNAIRETGCIISVLSPDYLNAPYPQAEWAAAFAKDPKGVEGRLKPVRVVECRPDGLLGQIIYIDLVGLDKGKAARRLLEGVNGGRAKPKEAPRFPGKAERSMPKEPVFPGLPRHGGLLPRRPLVQRVADFTNGQQIMVALDAIYVDGNRRCLVLRDALCLSDDTARSDVIRISSVGNSNDRVLHLHTMRQPHRWEMNQRVGTEIPGFLPIVFVNEDPMRVLPPTWDPFLQEVMPARYLKFTASDLMYMFEAGRYSVAPEDVLVTGQYEDEAWYWLRRQAQCATGSELDVTVAKGTHNGEGSLTVSLADLREHAARVQRREAASSEVERDYIEVAALPELF